MEYFPGSDIENQRDRPAERRRAELFNKLDALLKFLGDVVGI